MPVSQQMQGVNPSAEYIIELALEFTSIDLNNPCFDGLLDQDSVTIST